MPDHCGSDHHERQLRGLRTAETPVRAESGDEAEGGRRAGTVEPRIGGDGDRIGERRTATRADLIGTIAATYPHLPRAELRSVFEATLDEMSDALRRGEAVKLRSFGQFTVRAKRERVGRNPRTGVEVSITPRRVLTFRPSAVLLARVNGVAPEAGED